MKQEKANRLTARNSKSLVRVQGATLSDGINHGIQPTPIGNEDFVGACAGPQKCKDGYVQVAVGGTGPVRKLVEFFGFAEDPISSRWVPIRPLRVLQDAKTSATRCPPAPPNSVRRLTNIAFLIRLMR